MRERAKKTYLKCRLEEEFNKYEEDHNSIISKSNVLNLELERFLGDDKKFREFHQAGRR